MKKVFSNSMTAHVWAQQTQDEGRSSNGSLFFERNTIYSYGRHFPIAMITKNQAGDEVLIWNSDTYSNTTARHQRYVSAACKGELWASKIHLTTNSMKDVILFEGDSERLTTSIATDMRNIIRNKLESLSYCPFKRKAKIEEFRVNTIATIAAIYKEHCKLLECFSQTMPEDVTNQVNGLVNDTQSALESYYEQVREKNRLESIRIAEAAAARNALAKQASIKWINSEEIDYNEKWAMRESNQIYMRVKPDGEHIETSRHAEFPIEHGKKAFAFILKCHRDKTEWQRNGKTIHLGHFQIDKIESNGNVKAGCHYVEWEEIARIAIALNIYP